MTSSFFVEVESNIDDFANLMTQVGEKVLQRSRASATNKAMQKGRTAIRKDLSAETGVPSRAWGNRFKLKRANFRKPTATLFIGTMPFNTHKLGVRELKRGGLSVPASGGRKKEPSAFIAKMPSGHVGAFKRKRKSRLPIVELKIHVHKAARRAAHTHLKTIRTEFDRIVQREFAHRTRRELDRRGIRR